MFKSKIFIAFQYLVFITASFFLLKYCFGKIDFNSFYNTLKKGNYWMAIGVLAFSILSYISRILRWKIILNKVGENIGFMNNFSAIALGYLVSFIFPRGGEVVKCVVLNRTDNLSINKSISSTFFERLVDSLCLLILITVVVMAEGFTGNYLIINILEPLKLFSGNKVLMVAAIVVLCIIAGFVLYKKFKSNNNWLGLFLNHLKEMTGLFTNYKFTLHTIFIWSSYYFMGYLWFFVFESTSHLSMFQAFQIMMIGTVARSLPLPGGAVGAYHLAVAYGFTSMHIDSETALSLAFVIHGFQTIFTLLAGAFAMVWLFLFNKTYRIK